jgi:hypothetical protein
MSTRSLVLLCLTTALALPGSASAQSSKGWRGLLEQLGTSPGASVADAALSNDEIVGGLKEALAQGAERAVSTLGRSDGFLGNADVRVPLPGRLSGVGSTLRTLGQGRYVDEFEHTMNRAAEAAVPEASAILGDAIRQMTVEDARAILDGPEDAATSYFREVGEERLTTRMLPIVSEATSNAGVTSAYKGLLDRAGPAASLVGADLDLDGYVTSKALDGLFFMIAAEEKRIRENPVARSTDLLKKVFGGG